MLKKSIGHAPEALRYESRYDMHAKLVISNAREALKCETRYEKRAKKCKAMRAKPRNAKNVVKCILTIDISHAREALK